jgi:hypothetical protein
MKDARQKELLERARSGMTPSASHRARMRARLLGAVGAVGVAGAGTSVASAATASSMGTGLAATFGGKVSALVLVAGVVGAVSFTLHRASSSPSPGRTSSEPPGAASSHEASVPAPEPARVTATESGIEAPSDAEAPTDSSVADTPTGRSIRTDDPAPRPRGAFPSRAVQSPPVDPVSDEIALLDRARRALRDGRAADALLRLGEHERAHPGGVLAEERDALAVQALCEAGETGRATLAERRFGETYPGSLHRPRACVLDPER